MQYEASDLIAVEDSVNATVFSSFEGRLLLLPTGEVLLTANATSLGGNAQDVAIYTAGGTPRDEWRPAITSAPSAIVAGNSYPIAGRLFNGFSRGRGVWRRRADGDQLPAGPHQEQRHRARLLRPHA